MAPEASHLRLNRIQATSARGVRACVRRVAGCATPTGSAGQASATANLKLTFHVDHSAGADQSRPKHALGPRAQGRNRELGPRNSGSRSGQSLSTSGSTSGEGLTRRSRIRSQAWAISLNDCRTSISTTAIRSRAQLREDLSLRQSLATVVQLSQIHTEKAIMARTDSATSRFR